MDVLIPVSLRLTLPYTRYRAKSLARYKAGFQPPRTAPCGSTALPNQHAQRVDIDFGIRGHNDQQRHVIPRRRSSRASPPLSNGAISNGIASVYGPLLDCTAGLRVALEIFHG